MRKLTKELFYVLHETRLMERNYRTTMEVNMCDGPT
jgi:hypothetical protein